MHAAVRIEPVERPRAGPLVERHRAGPEAARGVAVAVVHAEIAGAGIDRRDRRDRARLEIEPREAVADGEHERLVALAERERADRLPDLEREIAPGSRIEPVDEAAHDVHPEQAPAAKVPDRPLAELGVRVEGDGDVDRPRHRVPLVPRRSQPASNSRMRPPVDGCAAHAS